MRGFWWTFSLLAVSLRAADHSDQCATCHPKQVSGYARTGMAHSLTRASPQPSGKSRHAISGSEFTIRSTPSGMYQQLEREGFRGEHRIEYVVGSGNHAFAYLVNVSGYLFQSPVSYYSKRAIWDMAPGYESDRNPDFTRPVTPECLWCHAGRPLPVEKTLNKYREPAFAEEAIWCDRCHGLVEAHLERPSAHNIINPKRLAPRARDSICEQCHLSGEARIPNPGRQTAEFRPGQTLEEVVSVYVFETPAHTGLKVISHAQQLALSACALQSGDRLWCGTCHNPHEEPEDPQAYYRAKCLGCHGGGLARVHPQPVEDCIRCHMPRRTARDGGHTAFTDHQIARRPASANSASLQPQKLVAWRQPAEALVQRNLGLAYVVVGERDRSSFHFEEAFGPLREARKAFPHDPPVLTSLGAVLLQRHANAEAAELFEEALRAEPGYAPYYVNVATSYQQLGRLDEAIQYLEKSINLDPSLEPAYRKLAEIYVQRRQPEKLRQVFSRYLKFMPNNVTARIALNAP